MSDINPEEYFADYHEPVDKRGLTERQALALEILDRDGRIPQEHRRIMAIHYRDLPEALYADIQDLAEMWDVGRTAIPSIIARAHQLLNPRVPGLLDPIIVRYTEAGYPRTRLWAAVDVAFWEKMRPRSEGRWPRSRQQWRRVLGLEPNEAASN